MVCSAVCMLTMTCAFCQQASGKLNEIDQSGIQCLFVALVALEIEAGEYERFESSIPKPAASNYSLSELADIAKSKGAKVCEVSTSFRNLRDRKQQFACIAHLRDKNRFVLIQDVDDQLAYLVDPPREFTVPVDTMSVVWNGDALLISREDLALVAGTRFGPMQWCMLIGAIFIATMAFLGVKRWRTRNNSL